MLEAGKKIGWYPSCPVPAGAIMCYETIIENDFDVREWAAPEFMEKAAKELLEERWQKVTAAKLPEATSLRLG